ncbi:flagellar filament capping protein FliD [Megalodesulfovibrio gigas]|nr:flagellar filament capping protein FliD [Megalodesulfovibrio gigas]
MSTDVNVGSITFTGLGSGTDFESMVTKLIEVESYHKKQMEAWKTEWETKIEALNEINTAMLNLKSTLETMDSMTEFLTKGVASSDSSVLTASADATAESGSHSIVVNQLAANAVITNANGLASKTTKVNTSTSAQTFAYSYKGNDYSVTVGAGATLEQMVSAINSDPANAGVRASIITDGSQYYLQMRGLDLGSNASLSFNASATTMSNAAFNDASDFSITQAARNAQVKVDGWPSASDAWIESNSNTLTDVVQGLTFNLKSLGSNPPAAVTISVETDYDSVKENIQSFVDNVNTVRSLVKTLTKFDENLEQGSVMTGNYAVQLVDSQLKQVTAEIGNGFLRYNAGPPATGDKISSLSQIGIMTDANEGSLTQGLLVIDAEILDDVLRQEPNAVAELFAATNIGGERVDTGNFSYYSGVTGVTKAGVYDVSYTVSGGVITGAVIDGKAANVDNEKGTITSMEGNSRGMVININDFPADSTGKGVVRLKQGKSGEMAAVLKDITNGETGALNILEDNYTDIIKSIDKKIDYEEQRLALMETNMRLKFSRLEALLGEYENLSTSMESQISQLSSS